MKSGYFNLVLVSGFITFAACSSAPPAVPLASNATPREEVAKYSADVQTAVAGGADLLAPTEFKQAQKWLDEAKQDLEGEQKEEEILSDVSKGRGYLESAVAAADKRRTGYEGLLMARKAAIAAGVESNSALTDRMQRLDDDVRDLAKAGKMPKPSTYSDLQSEYLKLEVAAIQDKQVGGARAAISRAIDEKAKRIAPQSLRAAQTDLISAENIISTNRHTPANYAAAVAKANASALFLQKVVAAMHSHDDIGESAAIDIARKDMRISKLDDASEQLVSARQAISMQQAIDTARKQFSSSEAEVFQQGNKLVIRLKEMKFPYGKSEVPSTSVPLLVKVKEVAESLDPANVVVEGHTDSTGAPQQNLELSQARAETIANFLAENGMARDKISSVGYGFQKPIATNRSSQGRAQNRRVDVIVTPAAGDAGEM